MSKLLFSLLALLLPITGVFAVNDPISDKQIYLRDESVTVTSASRETLDTFIGGVSEFFFTPSTAGDSVKNTFITIAFSIKNFFIAIAVIFLTIAVMKLLLSWGEEEDVKKWRRNIIWTSVGIFVMQIATSLWKLLYFEDNRMPDGTLGWQFWTNVFEPIVNILLLLAGFGFILMMVYAFYIIVTGGGDEEKVKKGKKIVIYALVGFLLIRIPKLLVTAIYGKPSEGCTEARPLSWGVCEMEEKKIEGTLKIFGNILSYINGFVMLVCVILVIYAGWLVLISAGDEEKLKKAKNTVIYIALGLVILVAGHAIFRFFILRG